MNAEPEPMPEAIKELLAAERARRETIAAALPAARAGLARLVDCCANKTGQSYKVRALLYSLWNGKPAALIEIVGLDHELREALLAVLRVFGSNDFFYETVADAFKAAGLFPWFTEESENSASLNP